MVECEPNVRISVELTNDETGLALLGLPDRSRLSLHDCPLGRGCHPSVYGQARALELGMRAGEPPAVGYGRGGLIDLWGK
jgi:hypothetical protein